MKSYQTNRLEQFQEIVGVEYAFSPCKQHSEWCAATYNTQAKPAIVVRPQSSTEAIEIIQKCNTEQITVEAISLGYNWGYGSRTPISNNSIQISLDRMKKIQMNGQPNWVTIEPGVSQAELCHYLRDTDSNYTMSVSGSSPHSSILGNALTGGYGNGLHTVRWDNLISFKVIDHWGHIQEVFHTDPDWQKWRGLMKNNAGGVVIEAVFELPEIPNYLEMYFFSIPSHTKKTQLLAALVDLKAVDLVDGNWSCLPDYRLIAEYVKTRSKITRTTDCIPRAELQEYYAHLPTEWRGSLAGVFSKQSATRAEAQQHAHRIAEALAPLSIELRSYLLDRQSIKSLRRDANHDIGQPLHDLIRGRILTFSGIVRNGSVPMSYWRKDHYPEQSLHLDRDGCGFIWLACTSTANPEVLSTGIDIVEETFSKHGFEPFYVVDGVASHEVYTMVAIVFDRDSSAEYQAALNCFQECKACLQAASIRTYRNPLEIEDRI